MSNKQTEQYFETLAETFDYGIDKLTDIGSELVSIPYETKAKREQLIQRLHDLQALLNSPEVQESIKQEDMENPSEGTPWHPKNINNAQYVSNCCSAQVDNYGRCMACKENCKKVII